MHPGDSYKDAGCYNKDELDREEEWLSQNSHTLAGTTQAPGWFLGDNDKWCHSAYIKVRQISDYNPPDGEPSDYGIVSANFLSG